jgi:hypothetical protein
LLKVFFRGALDESVFSLNSYIEAVTLSTQNMTVFGIRAFKGVIVKMWPFG